MRMCWSLNSTKQTEYLLSIMTTLQRELENALINWLEPNIKDIALIFDRVAEQIGASRTHVYSFARLFISSFSSLFYFFDIFSQLYKPHASFSSISISDNCLWWMFGMGFQMGVDWSWWRSTNSSCDKTPWKRTFFDKTQICSSKTSSI